MSSARPDVRTTAKPRAGSPGADDLALFHRTLAELCRSELPLPRALRLLAGDLRDGPLRSAAERMADEVERGASLTEAYAAHAERFPPLYRALVEAGLASGDLAGTLDAVADHAALASDVQARLRRALAPPLLSAAVVLLGGIGLLVFVAPAYAQIADALVGTVDNLQLDRSIGLQGRWIVAATALGVLALGAGGAFLYAYVRRPLAGASAVRSVRLRLPVIGPLRSLAALSSVAGTLALLVRRNVPLPRALALAGETVDDEGLRARLRDAADAAPPPPRPARPPAPPGAPPPAHPREVAAAAGRGPPATRPTPPTAAPDSRARCANRASSRSRCSGSSMRPRRAATRPARSTRSHGSSAPACSARSTAARRSSPPRRSWPSASRSSCSCTPS